MKKIIYLLTILIAISAIPSSAQHGRFFFRLIEGRAQLSRTGGSTWLSLQRVQPADLSPGDILQLSQNAKGVVFYPDGSIIRVKDGADFTIERDAIRLRVGYAWLEVRRRADTFRVFTPLASCHVLGTSFELEVNQFGHTTVRVFDGIVAVRANEDERNRQLVLQNNMSTLVNDSKRVRDEPSRFQSATVLTSLRSEWSERAIAESSAKDDFALPRIRDELPEMPKGLPPADEIIHGISLQQTAHRQRVDVQSRQTQEYRDLLLNQHLSKGIATDMAYSDTSEHGQEFSRYRRPESMITDQDDLERELYILRNELLKVQSRIRRLEMQISAEINQQTTSPVQKRRIADMQNELGELIAQQRFIDIRLRDLRLRKR